MGSCPRAPGCDATPGFSPILACKSIPLSQVLEGLPWLRKPGGRPWGVRAMLQAEGIRESIANGVNRVSTGKEVRKGRAGLGNGVVAQCGQSVGAFWSSCQTYSSGDWRGRLRS